MSQPGKIKFGDVVTSIHVIQNGVPPENIMARRGMLQEYEAYK
jgi:hypothetical protein